MEVVPFKAWHFYEIEPQAAQAHVVMTTTAAAVDGIERSGRAYTVLADTCPIACFGSVEVYPHRAVVWCLLDKNVGPLMHGCTRIGRNFVDSLPHDRIEMEVDWEFEAGHRWAKLLGFTKEVERIRCYNVQGGDSSIYSRVK